MEQFLESASFFSIVHQSDRPPLKHWFSLIARSSSKFEYQSESFSHLWWQIQTQKLGASTGRSLHLPTVSLSRRLFYVHQLIETIHVSLIKLESGNPYHDQANQATLLQQPIFIHLLIRLPIKINQMNQSSSPLISLKEVVQMPSKNQSFLGVVLDATGTYKTDDSIDYLFKAKIIDQTYNPTQPLKNKSKLDPFVMVFVFSQKIASSPQVTQIGDILYLKDFQSSTFEDSLVKSIGKKNSDWAVIDGLSSDFKVKQQSQFLKFSLSEQQKVKELQKWASNFFKGHSIRELSWYKSQDFSKPFLKQKLIVEQKDVDLVVKVGGFFQNYLQNGHYFKIIFIDEQLTQYYSEVKNIKINLEKNQVVKLRSVAVRAAEGSYLIDFYNYSQILLIPSTFVDAQNILESTRNCTVNQKELEQQAKNEIHLDKFIKEEINQYTNIYRSKKQKVNLLLLQDFQFQFQILKNFSLKNPLSMASVKEQFSSVVALEYEEAETTPLKDLQAVIEKFEKKDSKQKAKLWNEYQSKKFRVRVDIENVQFTELKEIVKIFDPKTGRIYDFKDINEAAKLNNPKMILFNVFQVTDESLEEEESLQLYLQTMDENPSCIFDLWQALPSLKIEEFQQQSKVKDAEAVLEESLLRLVRKENFDLIVEFKMGQEENIYLRIVDSMFWFV